MKQDSRRQCTGSDCLSADIVPISDAEAAANGYLRLASFNIRIFSHGSRDQGEVEAIASVLGLFDIVAIQELRDYRVLDRTVEVLNRMGAADWRYRASGPVGHGVKERYAILYRADRVRAMDEGQLIDNLWRQAVSDTPPEDSQQRKVDTLERTMRNHLPGPFLREPYIATFKARDFTFRLLTIHTIYKSKNSPQRAVELRQLAAVYRSIANANDGVPTILLGDFNDAPDHWRFKPILEIDGMTCLNRPPQKTTLLDISLYDTICMPRSIANHRLVLPDSTRPGSHGSDVLIFEDRAPFDAIAITEGRYKSACLAVSDHRPVHALFRMQSPPGP